MFRLKISFCFTDRVYDCDVVITDQKETKRYRADMADAAAANSDTFTVDITGTEFELTVSPRMADYKSILDDMEKQNWKDRLANKLCDKLISTFEKMLLQVACKYHLTGLKDGDTVTVSQQTYVFDAWSDWTDIAPVTYVFFEASSNGRHFALLNAFANNRKQVVRFVRGFALMDLDMLLFYPAQMMRVKRLTSNKKVCKTLRWFNQLDGAEREKVLRKQEKILSR